MPVFAEVCATVCRLRARLHPLNSGVAVLCCHLAPPASDVWHLCTSWLIGGSACAAAHRHIHHRASPIGGAAARIFRHIQRRVRNTCPLASGSPTSPTRLHQRLRLRCGRTVNSVDVAPSGASSPRLPRSFPGLVLGRAVRARKQSGAGSASAPAWPPSGRASPSAT
jgi:hypothetical protein